MKNISRFNILLMAIFIGLNNMAESTNNTAESTGIAGFFQSYKKTLLIISAALLGAAGVAYGANRMGKSSIPDENPSALKDEKPSVLKIVAKGIGTGILGGMSLGFGQFTLAQSLALSLSLATRTAPLTLATAIGGAITGALSLGSGYGTLKLGESTYKDYKKYSD